MTTMPVSPNSSLIVTALEYLRGCTTFGRLVSGYTALSDLTSPVKQWTWTQLPSESKLAITFTLAVLLITFSARRRTPAPIPGSHDPSNNSNIDTSTPDPDPNKTRSNGGTLLLPPNTQRPTNQQHRMDPSPLHLPPHLSMPARPLTHQTDSLPALPVGHVPVSTIPPPYPPSSYLLTRIFGLLLRSVTMGIRNMPWEDWIEVCPTLLLGRRAAYSSRRLSSTTNIQSTTVSAATASVRAGPTSSACSPRRLGSCVRSGKPVCGSLFLLPVSIPSHLTPSVHLQPWN